jgi:hypothetical protein
MQKVIRALGFLAIGSVVACSAVADDGNSNEQTNEVQGGKKDSAKSHNFAVGIANKLGAVCSGTLIAPNLVLTARHCVVSPDEGKQAVTCEDSFGDNIAPSNLFVTTEPVIRGAKNLYEVTEITTPEDTAFCGNDIALIRLAKNIPAEEAEPAIPVVNFSISDTARLTGQVAALGYGITAPNAADPGTRHIRQDIDIICVPGDANYDCSKTVYSTMIDSQREFITQGYVCSGDSGGGAFDQRSFSTTGQPYVLGALSRGPMNDTTCLAAIYSRTDVHKELIINAAKKAAELGSYEAADWVKGIAPAAIEPNTTGEADCTGDTCTSTDATDPASDAPAGPTTVTKTTSSCSSAPGTTTSGSAFGLLFGAAIVVAARRRRSA